MVFTSLQNGKKLILVLEGAGFRSFGTLVALDGIMNAISFHARKQLVPSDVFDVICGSSGGGLLAVLIGSLRLDCKTAIAVYRKLAKKLANGKDEAEFLKSMLDSLNSEPNSAEFDTCLRDTLSDYAPNMDPDSTFMSSTYSTGAETFVLVACSNPNRTFTVRSYPTPTVPPPLGHIWTNYEVARATLATRSILPAFSIQKYTFRDPAPTGYGNPVKFVKKELSTLCPNDETNIVLNLGTDFKSLPSRIPEVVGEILAKLPQKDRDGHDIKARASFIVKMYMDAAAETEKAWTNVYNSRVFPNNVLVRFEPTTGLAPSDLVDIFKLDEIERSVQGWIKEEARDVIADVTSEVVEAGSESDQFDREVLRHALPPRPPSDTNPGYNPSLDEPRPDTMVGYLERYHVVFIVDDSGSMKGARWDEAREALLEIAHFAEEYNCHEIDIRFLNHKQVHKGVQGKAAIDKFFSAIKIGRDGTPTGACLDVVVNEHLTRLDQAVNTPEYGNIRPLDIILLTDGVPDQRNPPGQVLARAVKRRENSHHHPNAIGIQIVQIGNDDEAGPAMESLMKEEGVQSMVDTFKYADRNGPLTPKELERIILGGLHPNVRALLPKSAGGSA